MIAVVTVYEKNRDKFRSAETDYTIIDFLVGKLIHETNGKVTPELATKTIKAIVESMKTMRMKGEI